MSVWRLIFAVVWLLLGAVTLRWRTRWGRGRFARLLLALGVLYLLLGLLWLDLAL